MPPTPDRSTPRKPPKKRGNKPGRLDLGVAARTAGIPYPGPTNKQLAPGGSQRGPRPTGVTGTAAYPGRAGPAPKGSQAEKPPPEAAPPDDETTDEDGETPEEKAAREKEEADTYAYLLSRYPGLPPAEAAEILTRTQAGQTDDQIIQWLRGTDWYKKEFHGIDGGIQTGLYGDEAGYRDYKNGITQVLAENGITDEWSINNYVYNMSLGGWSVNRVSQEFQADAWVRANAADVGYVTGAFGGGALTQEELKETGLQESGVGTDLGQTLQKRVGDAYAKMQRVFQGQLGQQELAPTVFGNRRQRGDVGA